MLNNNEFVIKILELEGKLKNIGDSINVTISGTTINVSKVTSRRDSDSRIIMHTNLPCIRTNLLYDLYKGENVKFIVPTFDGIEDTSHLELYNEELQWLTSLESKPSIETLITKLREFYPNVTKIAIDEHTDKDIRTKLNNSGYVITSYKDAEIVDDNEMEYTANVNKFSAILYSIVEYNYNTDKLEIDLLVYRHYYISKKAFPLFRELYNKTIDIINNDHKVRGELKDFKNTLIRKDSK